MKIILIGVLHRKINLDYSVWLPVTKHIYKKRIKRAESPVILFSSSPFFFSYTMGCA